MELLGLWALLMIPAIAILVIWFIVSTPTAHLAERDGKEHFVCDTGGFTGPPGGLVFFFILVAYAALVLLLGVILSILARKVPSQFNESKLIAFSIYNIAFLCAVIIPVFLTVQPFNPYLAWIFRTVAIIYAFSATMFLQFVPKLIGIFILDRGTNPKPRIINTAKKSPSNTLKSTKTASISAEF